MAITAPVALGIAAAATSAVGTVVSVASSQQQAKARAAAAEYNAQVAANERKRAQLERDEQSRRDILNQRKELAKQRIRAAKSGVLETGSVLESLSDSASLMELERLDKVRAANIRAQQFGQQSTLFSAQASNSRAQGLTQSIGIGLSGAATTAGHSISAIDKSN